MSAGVGRVRAGAVLYGVAAGCVGFGASVLVLAAGLALWGWLVAAPSVSAGMWDPFGWEDERWWRNGFPVRPAVSVVGIAATLIGAVMLAWWRDPRNAKSMVWPGPRALAICAVLYLGIGSGGLPSFYRLVMANYPVSAAVPMVVAAWLLTIGGVVAVLVATALPGLRHTRARAVTGGIAVGVIAAVVFTVLAVRAGDDRRYVESTVAAAVQIPAAPARFGARRFSLRVSDWPGSPASQPDVQVAAAGAGFVVFHDGQVTGYGSDGAERWHYRRTGPGRVSAYGVRVFDGGRTVAVALAVGRTDEPPVLVGLDAVTGQQLWSAGSRLATPEANSFHPHRNRHGDDDNDPSPFLIATRSSDTSTWTRLNTRTGAPLWSIPSPIGPGCWGKPADTATRIATAVLCYGEHARDLSLVVLDPDTGQQRWRTTLAADLPIRKGDRPFFHVTPAGRDGVEIRYSADGGAAINSYVNTVDQVVRELGPNQVAASPQRAELFVTEHAGQDGVTGLSLFDASGAPRCALPGTRIGEDPMGDYYTYLPLAGEMLLYDSKGQTFAILDTNTCAVRRNQPAPPVPEWLAAAPGIVLVQRSQPDGTYLDGYA